MQAGKPRRKLYMQAGRGGKILKKILFVFVLCVFLVNTNVVFAVVPLPLAFKSLRVRIEKALIEKAIIQYAVSKKKREDSESSKKTVVYIRYEILGGKDFFSAKNENVPQKRGGR